MGLDLYVGPLTRYHLGSWQTIVQQIGEELGLEVHIHRADPPPNDKITDPAAVRQRVQQWQTWLGEALGRPVEWPEGAELPYWTDKPDWDGYGGVVLLASYDERPDLRPAVRRGVRGHAIADRPRDFEVAQAFRAASAEPQRYPSLLSGVEWWLPLPDGPAVFHAPRTTGQQTRMGCVDGLVYELRMLRDRVSTADELQDAMSAGPPWPDAPAEVAGRFGLAVMLDLAERAQEHRQPLLMDY